MATLVLTGQGSALRSKPPHRDNTTYMNVNRLSRESITNPHFHLQPLPPAAYA